MFFPAPPSRPKPACTYHDPLNHRATTQRFAPWRCGNTNGSLEGRTRDSSPRKKLPPSLQKESFVSQATRASFCSLLAQRLALRRSDPTGDKGTSSVSVSVHPLHKLRAMGASVCNVNKLSEGGAFSLLDELVVHESDSVRLYDVEGRMFAVQGNATGTPSSAFSIVPHLSAREGNCVFMRLLPETSPYVSCDNQRTLSDHMSPPRWKKYATAVALYIALADAGYCDPALPFLSIQWINLRRLLREHIHLRLDLASCRVRCSVPALGHALGPNDTVVPVALIAPIAMKGKLRCPFNPEDSAAPSLFTQPFTDAEVFQLFYLQLVFRAVFDVRFPGMTSGEDGRFFRSDLIGSHVSEKQPLAFEHPSVCDRWLLFPSRSRVIHFVALEEAVIPHYASRQECCETAQQRLFGATPLLPCQGALGRHVVTEWAMKCVISSAHDASIALRELFDLFEEPYGVRRAEICQAQVTPRIYRCNQTTLTRLWANNKDLSCFFSSLCLSLSSSSTVKQSLSAKKQPHVLTKEAEEEEDAIVRRWRQYIQDGSIALFDGDTDAIEVVRLLGTGGSSLVYEGRFGPQRRPVAVKCLIRADGVDHETYVKESLTNVAFFVLFNQLETYGIVTNNRIYDFIVCGTPPKGMPEEDVRTCSREANANSGAKLCYLVTGLMDGVIGRFLTEEEDDFDPCYDTIVNAPLRDGEVFQFLFIQLLLRALFDCIILDLMLHGQLRGDNIGYRYVLRDEKMTPSLPSYDGIIIIFQTSCDVSPRYLRLPAGDIMDVDKLGPLRLICLIDLGQGKQPTLEGLTQRRFIGETVVESCIQEDGMGRYWPLSSLYSKDVETRGSVARRAVEWGASLRIDSPRAAEDALRELFELYVPAYGVARPTAEEMSTHLVFRWTPEAIARLRRHYVYRTDGENRNNCSRSDDGK